MQLSHPILFTSLILFYIIIRTLSRSPKSFVLRASFFIFCLTAIHNCIPFGIRMFSFLILLCFILFCLNVLSYALMLFAACFSYSESLLVSFGVILPFSFFSMSTNLSISLGFKCLFFTWAVYFSYRFIIFFSTSTFFAFIFYRDHFVIPRCGLLVRYLLLFHYS
jgi:hypothetical protein